MTDVARHPLTLLTDEEREFQTMVREFAVEKVKPRVSKMDHDAKLDKALVKEIFDLGIMGIEIPPELGGAGATFFMSILAVEEMSHVDPSIGVIVDVQNTLFNNAILRWGTPEQKEKYFPRMAKDTMGAY
ncbi:MAG: acyl-CoA dehydrogenase family protein, partial [Candidatus Binatia bacterium]